ncbi:hypothetical protein NPIL_329061 [Nephila pilipes]|uniref:Uncharacterized protein n=1 Tax=Nephila pilipes TaxID=299642 RepID=A0A8X6QFD5_NEPPI|nr:hypothetical protein NPIL_329061 [Nephila pilipes]
MLTSGGFRRVCQLFEQPLNSCSETRKKANHIKEICSLLIVIACLYAVADERFSPLRLTQSNRTEFAWYSGFGFAVFTAIIFLIPFSCLKAMHSDNSHVILFLKKM